MRAARRGLRGARGASPRGALAACRAASSGSRPLWLPGAEVPDHLDGALPGDYGFDPLGLGVDPAKLKWYREAELQHARWAMAATAGILAQEVVKPDVFFYDAPTKISLPFSILGLVAFQAFTMHYVEIRRWRDLVAPGSVDQDPIFADQKLPPHDVGYPGGPVFTPFGVVGGDLETLKEKEIRNGRLAMLAFVGFIMAAQVNGKGPIACFKDHVADPWGQTIYAKGAVTPFSKVAPECQIAPSVEFEGVTIPTPCFLEGLWP